MKFLVLNLKAYPESGGLAGYRLAKVAGAVAKNVATLAGVKVILIPQLPDVSRFSEDLRGTTCDVFSPHADALEAGAHTGFVPPESVKAAGAQGILLNHSEHRVNSRHMAFVSRRAKELNLATLFCGRNVREAARVAKLYSPTMVAVEPPELIGGDVSVSTAQPEVVREGVRAIRKAHRSTLALVGAGVRTPEDVRKSIELGADGVLLAHAFVKAADPEAFLKQLVLSMAAGASKK